MGELSRVDLKHPEVNIKSNQVRINWLGLIGNQTYSKRMRRSMVDEEG